MHSPYDNYGYESPIISYYFYDANYCSDEALEVTSQHIEKDRNMKHILSI